MKITVCIGSSCHLKGSRSVVEQLQHLIDENDLSDKVSLNGTFCLGHCVEGVCVMTDDVLHSVNRDEVEAFFNNEVLAKL